MRTLIVDAFTPKKNGDGVTIHGIKNVEQQYKLIEEITLTETVEKVIRSGLSLDACQIKMYTPAHADLSSATGIVTATAFFENMVTANNMQARIDGALSKTVPSYMVFGKFEKNKGLWDVGISFFQQYSDNPLRIPTYPGWTHKRKMLYKTDNYPTIRYLEVGGIAGSTLPVGTVIQIYGVRV